MIAGASCRLGKSDVKLWMSELSDANSSAIASWYPDIVGSCSSKYNQKPVTLSLDVMKVIIQCAASKKAHSGTLYTAGGKRVAFVADPIKISSLDSSLHYAKPDDCAGDSTWRVALDHYNSRPDNVCGLRRAADLYSPKEHDFRDLYRDLVDAFGWDNVFILSAGWGLIRSSYLTPDYNITFSARAKTGKKPKPWVWRDPKEFWPDLNHFQRVVIGDDEPIHVFCGADYRPLLYSLTKNFVGRKIIHHKGDVRPYPGFEYEAYEGSEKNRTWHYRAAKDFLLTNKMANDSAR